VQYCRKITDLYLQAFKKSELEFDISRLPWIRAVGSAADAAAIDSLLEYLRAEHVFLAFDAWESADADLLSKAGPTRNGLVQGLRYLSDYKRMGGRIGLECFAPLRNSRMGTGDLGNAHKLAAAVLQLRPDRLVFFADVARASQPGDAAPDEPDNHARELLRMLGYGFN
jgi:hypothetical protein